jgi:hypothetical protein
VRASPFEHGDRAAGRSWPCRPRTADGTRLTDVAVRGYQLAACTWNATGLSRPLFATSRTDSTHLGGDITSTDGGTTLVGPNRATGTPWRPSTALEFAG